MDEKEKKAPETVPAAAAKPKAVEVAGVGKVIKAEDLKPGMTVRVHEKIKDVSSKGEERERVQIFEGIILSLRGTAASRTMTIQKQSGTWAVEKIFPIRSPIITKLEVVKTAKVRRAKLQYLSDMKKPFKRRLKEKRVE